MVSKRSITNSQDSTANLGFQAKLWLDADKGRISAPVCGSGRMVVQSEEFVEPHDENLGDISVYGQESNGAVHRRAMMNLALRRFKADFGPEHASTFRHDIHPVLRACGDKHG